ncbi:MAG: Unknown protein [uncultured Sulfurovum sp.]|uniref:DNA mimic protein DMP19 C-terminal domain-containing protein n=1 Tax=uncultured Sulfurovum sp. TaxID=269237 RepID=A0A6S6SSD9_9BACT|nr:MAG: Unknown protein [uncultured Sulfurovum sp.]
MQNDTIIVTLSSFHNPHKYEIIASNTEYITKLFQNNLSEDQISENALKSYYVDYYHSHIIHGGFHNFINEFKKNYKILYYIRLGLKALSAEKHLKLFNAIFPEVKEKSSIYNTNKLDMAFNKLEKYENLVTLNYQWLIKHPKLLIVEPKSIHRYLQQHIITSQHEYRHIKIIKQLCKIIDEDFIAITAGDINNIYNRAWHFKTVKNYYYIIEKNHIVTLYNSFTKQEITKGRLVANKTEQSLVSNFISKMLA